MYHVGDKERMDIIERHTPKGMEDCPPFEEIARDVDASNASQFAHSLHLTWNRYRKLKAMWLNVQSEIHNWDSFEEWSKWRTERQKTENEDLQDSVSVMEILVDVYRRRTFQ